MVQIDKGMILLDPDRFYEFEEFEPGDLVDHNGNRIDEQGVPYIEHYRAGKVSWMAPGNHAPESRCISL